MAISNSCIARDNETNGKATYIMFRHGLSQLRSSGCNRILVVAFCKYFAAFLEIRDCVKDLSNLHTYAQLIIPALNVDSPKTAKHL